MRDKNWKQILQTQKWTQLQHSSLLWVSAHYTNNNLVLHSAVKLQSMRKKIVSAIFLTEPESVNKVKCYPDVYVFQWIYQNFSCKIGAINGLSCVNVDWIECYIDIAQSVHTIPVIQFIKKLVLCRPIEEKTRKKILNWKLFFVFLFVFVRV